MIFTIINNLLKKTNQEIHVEIGCFIFCSLPYVYFWFEVIDFLRSKLIFCHNDLSWTTMGKSSFVGKVKLFFSSNPSSWDWINGIINVLLTMFKYSYLWLTNNIFVIMCPLGLSYFQHLPFRHSPFDFFDSINPSKFKEGTVIKCLISSLTINFSNSVCFSESPKFHLKQATVTSCMDFFG